jgi:mRNA-degrading endonuclease RelE of RelBE toxin-antitoxin system
MEFIETSRFTKLIYSYLTDDEYVGLQGFMFMNPEAGDVVPGSGGVRKLRWAATGRGKRGGVRIIYYFKKRDSEIWMLTVYGKNQVENIPAHILRLIVEEIKNV